MIHEVCSLYVSGWCRDFVTNAEDGVLLGSLSLFERSVSHQCAT